jgi:chromosome segregation ATPase
MERIDRNEKNDTQKARLIFLSLAALVVIILIWSLISMSRFRLERDAARHEVEMLNQDNAKLDQMVKDLNQENEGLKKKIQQLQEKLKAKPAVKKKTKSKSTKSTSKKKTTKPTN